jgi:hypothetical protein
MKGDFSRMTFDPAKRYDSVRMQQGRVQVDADWNEQVDIATYQHEQALADVIGGCCAPEGAAGFSISANGGDLEIGTGRVYIDGILCEQLDPDLTYLAQTDYPAAPMPDNDGTYLVWLDVWKWHVTALEDPSIRETALGGPDTATRLKTVCQVKLQLVDDGSDCADLAIEVPNLGGLAARTRPEDTPDNVCIVPATAGYTRLENYLYRVEVHEGGVLGVDSPTFKWSRNNGTIVTDWLSQEATAPNRLVVRSTGRDKLLGFHDARWVELTDDDHELRGEPGELVEVIAVQDDVIEIDPGALVIDIANYGEHPKIRRWDMDTAGGAIAIEIAPDNDGYIPIESGIQVLFEAGEYRTGDYWLVPARAFIGQFAGDIEWPQDNGGSPLVEQPHGIRHKGCKLAIVTFDGTDFTLVSDCRNTFASLCALEPGCCTNVVEPGEDIQAAIDSLPEEGGCVCLKTGLHEIDEPLRIERSNVLLHGESPGTRVAATVLPLLSVGALAPRAARVEIRDIRFESVTESAEADQAAAIALTACDEVRIERCGIGAIAEQVSGIVLWDTDAVTIAECHIVVPLNGIWVIEDSLRLDVKGNHLQATGFGEGTDPGGVAVYAEMQFASCRVEDNRIEGFAVGVALNREPFGEGGFSGANGSVVHGNRITRIATNVVDDASRLYGIDVAAIDCRVSGNVLDYGSSRYGGIRANGLRHSVEGNRITSFAREAGTEQLPVGVRVGLGGGELLATDMVVRENTIIGVQDGIVVLDAERIVVRENRVSSPQRGLRNAILFDGVTSGRVENNYIAAAATAVQFGNGERNAALDNDIHGGGTGLVVEQDNSVEIGGNQFRQTGGLAVQISSWIGPARLHHNRCHGCGHELDGAAAAIAAMAGFGELQVESCDIRDTGRSPDGGSPTVQTIGLFGMLLLQASVQSNNISAAALEDFDIPDPTGVPPQRAVYLLGFLDYQVSDNINLGFVAQILDNRFSGIGAQPVVELTGFRVNNNFWVRFNRVLYSENFCWHLDTDQDGAASVRINAASASAMGNHFKALSQIAPIDFGATDALYMGNDSSATTPALGSFIRPTPQSSFNR